MFTRRSRVFSRVERTNRFNGQIVPTQVASIPTQVASECLGDEVIVMVVACCQHTVAVDAAGKMYTRGYGKYLGQNLEDDALFPTRLDHTQSGGSHIIMVATGLMHTMAVDTDGRLWTWGNDKDGALRLGITGDKLVPTCAALTRL